MWFLQTLKIRYLRSQSRSWSVDICQDIQIVKWYLAYAICNKYLHSNFISGALKPKDHCCYDICGAVIHIETNPDLYGYGNTLDILHDAVWKFLPTMDENIGGNKKDSYSRVSVAYKGIAMPTQSI